MKLEKSPFKRADALVGKKSSSVTCSYNNREILMRGKVCY